MDYRLATSIGVALVASLAACTASIVEDGPGGAGSGAGGAGGSGGGGASCVETHESVKIGIESDDGTSYGCGVFEGYDVSLQGTVVGVEGGVVTIDTCPPNADCIASLTRVQIEASGLSIPLSTGQLVTVDLSVPYPEWCSMSIAIHNLPSWGGVANAYDSSSRLYVAASEGNTDVLDDALTITRIPLGCGGFEPDGCEATPDDYAMQFVPAAGPPVQIGMGETSWVQIGTDAYRAKDLKSFETGFCDAEWDWSYWIVFQPPLEG